MTAVDHIKAAQKAGLVGRDGDPVVLELAPGLEAHEIDALEKEVGQPLPEELRSLLSFCSGIDGCLDGIDFTGRDMAFEHKEVFPNGLPIARDGYGNFWVLDITPQTATTAPVFFACHDAPVVLYQSPDLASFLAEVFRMSTPPHESLVDDVHQDRLFQVCCSNPGVIDQSVAAAASDPALRAFAEALPGNFQIVDLRTASPGMGFSWGRYGPRTELRRHGYDRIFGYAKTPPLGVFTKQGRGLLVGSIMTLPAGIYVTMEGEFFPPGAYPLVVLILPALGAASALFIVGCLLFRALGWRVLRDSGGVDGVGKE
jgi:cell wall assembly regulator SMI1